MCKICQYNQVKNIDRLLLAGQTPASVSRRYPGFTASELQRHAEHLQQKMALASGRFQASLHQGLFCKLHMVMEMNLQVIRRTKTADDPKLFFQASREFTRIITLMDKMAAKIHFDPEFIYCLMANPQWDLQEDTLLPYAFQALAESRRTLKQQVFFTPCPEPDLELAGHAPGGTQDLELETITASPNPLPEVAATLARPQNQASATDQPSRH
jgi:hypothetical protein